MIKKYRIGEPFETEAVVVKLPEQKEHIPYFHKEADGCYVIKMEKDDIVYGLGENVRGINKRGWRYISNCSDDPHHQEDKNSLYGAHNFFVLQGSRTFGVFIDFPGKIEFDVGYSNIDEFRITIAENDFDFYLLEADSVPAIVKEFRHIIGRSYIPPRWAFGYGQSRWSYMNEDEVRDVVRGYRENHIPLDSIYLDIDYMERYKDFTVDKDRFPDLATFAAEMKSQNVHLVPIIDAGVKIEDGYDVYEEGVEKNYFCKDEEGNDFVVAVWPGRTHFPDMLNKDAREWFGNKYQVLLDQGIDGFWNDMNEPAIFYSEVHLKEVFEKLNDFKGRNLDLDVWREFSDLIGGISNNPEDYKRFYHNVNGKRIRHDKVHNLFGYNMTRAAGEAFERLVPDKRILMFSRSSYVGMHRYGGIWQGDNKSWWSHILMNMQMMPSLNMCGILYTGADIGGFGCDATEDLLARWLAFGVFTPLMRNHAAYGTRQQEAYRFTQTEVFRTLISIRYQLLPYIYSEFMKAVLQEEMMFRPVAFDYPEDKMAREIQDQLMVGDSIMIAPVYTQNANGRNVYLPERMKMITLGAGEDLEGVILEAGWHYIDMPMDGVKVFVKPDHILTLSEGGECVEDIDFTKLRLVSYIVDGAEYIYYHDDGISKDYDNEQNLHKITLTKDGTVNPQFFFI